MKHSTGYKIVKVGSISKKKLSRALKGGTISLSKEDLTGSHEMLVHPENYKKIEAAKSKNKGVRLDITRGEIEHDLKHHAGGSLWDFLKEKVWPVVKTVLGGVGDAIAYSNPELAPLREGIRGLTGVGLKTNKGLSSC